ncbi:MAG: gamma-glutamyltransferase [Bdellovibrionota bacterium]
MRFLIHFLPLILASIAASIAASTAASTALAVPSKGHRIMVSGPSPDSPAIATRIHAKGGNVVDAPVAVGLGLAVTHPYYAALGGGGFAMVKMGAEVKALDFRETAPKSAGPDTYKDTPGKASLDGGLAVGIPGVVAGLAELHKKHGKLKWADVVQPSIELAERGFEVSGDWVDLTNKNRERFNPEAREILFPKGKALRPGDRLKQPKLAGFLRRLQREGPKAFYGASNAKKIVAVVNANGGSFSEKDFADYKTRWLEPIVADFRGTKLHLMPPPSSGGVVIAQAVRLVEKLNVTATPNLSVEELHLLIEIQKQSFRARSLLGDPDFVKNPIAEIVDEKAIDKLASVIDRKKAAPSMKFLSDADRAAMAKATGEKEQTTHYSLVDAQGNAVAITTTLNGDYGSGLIEPETGIALNNEMDDFTTKPGVPNMFGLIQGEANKVQAGARPLSSMSPTIVEKDGKTILAIGSPGGPRIISAVFQVIYRILARDYDADLAIQTSRVHHQFLPDVVKTDALRFPPETLDGLKARGHVVEFGSTAKVYVVKRNGDGLLEGAADRRGEGAAGGN